MKVADIKVEWDPSPSEGIASQSVEVTVDGYQQSSIELGPVDAQVMIEVGAGKKATVVVKTTDDEGNVVASTTYVIRLGDLESPLPATNFRHSIVAVREDPEEEEEPSDEEPSSSLRKGR